MRDWYVQVFLRFLWGSVMRNMVYLRDGGPKSRAAVPLLDLPRSPLSIKSTSGQLLYKGERTISRKEDRWGAFRPSHVLIFLIDDTIHSINSKYYFKTTSAYRNLSYHGFTSKDHLDGKKWARIGDCRGIPPNLNLLTLVVTRRRPYFGFNDEDGTQRWTRGILPSLPFR